MGVVCPVHGAFSVGQAPQDPEGILSEGDVARRRREEGAQAKHRFVLVNEKREAPGPLEPILLDAGEMIDPLDEKTHVLRERRLCIGRKSFVFLRRAAPPAGADLSGDRPHGINETFDDAISRHERLEPVERRHHAPRACGKIGAVDADGPFAAGAEVPGAEPLHGAADFIELTEAARKCGIEVHRRSPSANIVVERHRFGESRLQHESGHPVSSHQVLKQLKAKGEKWVGLVNALADTDQSRIRDGGVKRAKSTAFRVDGDDAPSRPCCEVSVGLRGKGQGEEKDRRCQQSSAMHGVLVLGSGLLALGSWGAVATSLPRAQSPELRAKPQYAAAHTAVASGGLDLGVKGARRSSLAPPLTQVPRYARDDTVFTVAVRAVATRSYYRCRLR